MLVTPSLLLAVCAQASSLRHDSPGLESTEKCLTYLPLPQQMADKAILVEDLSLILTSCVI